LLDASVSSAERSDALSLLSPVVSASRCEALDGRPPRPFGKSLEASEASSAVSWWPAEARLVPAGSPSEVCGAGSLWRRVGWPERSAGPLGELGAVSSFPSGKEAASCSASFVGSVTVSRLLSDRL